MVVLHWVRGKIITAFLEEHTVDTRIKQAFKLRLAGMSAFWP